MAENNFSTLMVGLIFFVGFTVLMLSVAVNFGAEYGKSSDDIGGGSLNLEVFNNTANSIEGNASAMRSSFESGSVDNIDDASGMFGTIKKIVNLVTSPFTLLAEILVNILKWPSIIVNIILGVLSILLILGMWSVLRSGN